MGKSELDFVNNEKDRIRKEKIKLRRALTNEQIKKLSDEICKRIIASEEYRKSEKILVYNAVNGEVSLKNLIETAKTDGKTLAYPLCKANREMAALVPENDKAFIAGAFGIPEPDESRSEVIEPEQIDMVICPMTAFDEKCRRLGMGGGYYDRYLPRCRNSYIAAAAYEFQKINEVPAGEFDFKVQAVYTEKNIYMSE